MNYDGYLKVKELEFGYRLYIPLVALLMVDGASVFLYLDYRSDTCG